MAGYKGNWHFEACTLPQDYEDLRASVRALAEEQIAPHAHDVDDQARFPKEALDALRGAGFDAPHVPEEYGGQGADALATVIVVEEIARACMSSSLIPGVNKLGSLPLMISGSKELKAKYLTKLAAGEPGATHRDRAPTAAPAQPRPGRTSRGRGRLTGRGSRGGQGAPFTRPHR